MEVGTFSQVERCSWENSINNTWIPIHEKVWKYNEYLHTTNEYLQRKDNYIAKPINSHNHNDKFRLFHQNVLKICCEKCPELYIRKEET